MPQVKKQNRFFLISFIPALAYWYLEANFSLQVALTGGVSLAFLELLLERILFQHIHTISKINFMLIVILGGIAFWGGDGIWFKLQPFFTGMGLGSILFIQNFRGKSIMWKTVCEFQDRPPPYALIETMEKHIAIFTIIYGIFMGALAIWRSTEEWVFFKTAGFYIAFLLFATGEVLFLRKKINQK